MARIADMPATAPCPEVQAEIDLRLLSMARTAIFYAVGILTGTAVMAIRTGDAGFWVLLGLATLTSAGRLAVYAAFRWRFKTGTAPPAETAPWIRIQGAAMIAGNIVLAAFTFYSFHAGEVGGMVLAMGLALAQSSAVSASVPRSWIAVPMIVLALVPLAIAFLLTPDFVFQCCGLLILFYMVSTLQTQRYAASQLEALLTARLISTKAANHDALTGLLSRRRFEALLGEAERARQPFGLLMLDLDGFKPVNDEFGHAGGDDILRQVAQRLTTLVRDGDHVARYGGDEFAILLRDVADPAEMVRIGERIVAEMRQPFHLGRHVVKLGASVGAAFADPDAPPPAEVLKKLADDALYGSKRDGKGRLRSVIPRAA